jgi:HK97 gp10 family phage protein
MKVVVKVKVEGLRELGIALSALPKATAKSVLKRVLTKRAKPMAQTMFALAPDNPATTGKGDLRTSIGVSSRLSKRQARLHRKAYKDDKQFAEVFVGAGALPQAHMQEFGTEHNRPQAFARPAWDKHQGLILEGLKDDLWAEIQKTAKRVALKKAKAAG